MPTTTDKFKCLKKGIALKCKLTFRFGGNASLSFTIGICTYSI